MKLKEDLYSIDNKLLLKSGKKINAKTLNRIAENNKRVYYLQIKNTMLVKDVKKAMEDKRYNIIFSNRQIRRRVLSILKKGSLPKNILKELKLIKSKLPYTYHHMLLITALATQIALDKNFRNKFNPKRFVRIGLAHDIGKSRIPIKILNKRTALTKEEHRIIKMHPIIGYLLLHYYYGKEHSKYDYVSFEHHERLDGTGYPRGIKKINRYSQLIAVIDTLDALITARPYRKTPYTLRAAIDFLLDEAFRGRLNKKMVLVLISYARKDKPNIKDLSIFIPSIKYI